MERVIRANLHALAAADATRQKIRFIKRARRTYAASALLCGEGSGDAHQRENRRTGSQAGKNLAPLEAGGLQGIATREKLKFQAVVRALTDAIQAEMTFGPAPGNAADGVIAALAPKQAAIAAVTGNGVFLQAEDGPAGNESEQRTEGAKRAAKESRDPKIQRQHENKKETEEKALAKMGLLQAQHREV